jgi:ATP/maltotriose-dependent transcriptional regulator MalT
VDDRETLLGGARRARADRRFGDAYEAFRAAGELAPLPASDLRAFGDAAWWLGRTDEALLLSERAYQRLLEEGAPRQAALEAVGLGFLLLLRGDLASGSGWISRGRSLLEHAPGTREHGYLMHLDAGAALQAGDLERAIALARQAQEAGRQAADPTLTALALMTEGSARIHSGAVADGMAALDAAMLPVQAGQVPPEFAGNLYCQMIAICWELADLRRARQWTEVTERWCDGFDSAVMFAGICRMHRVQLRQVAGDWDTAAAEARKVCTELAGMNVAVVAEGHYLLGDLLRLRGDADGAGQAYRRAHELGRQPQPGMALLRAAAGQAAVAVSSLQTALVAARGAGYSRAPLLRALAEVAVDAGDLKEAGAAAEELDALASTWGTDGLLAAAAHARGAVQLATGHPGDALASLRDAVGRWQQLQAPYDCALSRLRLGQVYAALGDHDAAALELDAAASTLESLEATVELQRLGRLRSRADLPGGLTPREAEVLAHVAEGGTNRQVAHALFISEKTVARHLANVYLKLGVPTRTAAASWARRNGLRRPT